MQLNLLIGKTFRSNPSYALIELTHLSQSEQNALIGLTIDENVFGVFKPLKSDSRLSYKVAYKEVAILFYFLQQPSELPAYLKNTFDDDVNITLAKLVLDGILEIRSITQFVSGVNAQEIIYKTRAQDNNDNLSRIQVLSYKAIRYALELNDLNIQAISARLYCYNTVPSLCNGEYQLNTVKEVKKYLGVENDSKLAMTIARDWYYQQPSELYPWLSWRRNDSLKPDFENEHTYKIYISPLIESLPEVFETSVRILTKTRAFSFKIGSSAEGLLRSDKFVIYFNSYRDLLEAVPKLNFELNGFKVQGVPFTGQLDNNGLLSWGIDPPHKQSLENLEGGSWRTIVTRKIASAILQTKSAALTNDTAIDFIVSKIFLEGIDPFTWVPNRKFEFEF